MNQHFSIFSVFLSFLVSKTFFFCVTLVGDCQAMPTPRIKKKGRGAVAMTWLSNGERPRRTHRHLPVPSSMAQTAKKKTHRQGSCPPAIRSDTNSLDHISLPHHPDYSYFVAVSLCALCSVTGGQGPCRCVCFLFCGLRQRGRHRQMTMCAPWAFTVGQPSHRHGSSSLFFYSWCRRRLEISYQSDTK